MGGSFLSSFQASDIRYDPKQQVYPQIRYLGCKLLKINNLLVADEVAASISVALPARKVTDRANSPLQTHLLLTTGRCSSIVKDLFGP
jgi:hypothetical protein